MSRRDKNLLLDKMIAEIATTLESNGFQRRGKAIKAVFDGNAKIIEFQIGEDSTDQQTVFTINLGVVCGDLLDPERVDLQRSTILDAHLRTRLGRLLEVPNDNWWTLAGSSNLESLTRELSVLIMERALPYLERYQSTEALIRLWESGMSPGITAVQRSRYLSELADKKGHIG